MRTETLIFIAVAAGSLATRSAASSPYFGFFELLREYFLIVEERSRA